MDIRIRLAEPEDAVEAVAVVRRSIIELCLADHAGDPAVLDKWLANKTAANFCDWIAHPAIVAHVATRGPALCGLGLLRSDGAILLTYVDPDARFSGVSAALLSAMEAEAWRGGATACTLESTRTALRFYLSRGYIPDPGDPSGLNLRKARP